MLLDGPPSWRQRSRPQPANQAQNLREQISGDGDFRELERDVATMAHNLGPDLDQLLAQRSAANALLPPIRLTSPLGHKQKSSVGLGMSALGGKADLNFERLDVCF